MQPWGTLLVFPPSLKVLQWVLKRDTLGCNLLGLLRDKILWRLNMTRSQLKRSRRTKITTFVKLCGILLSLTPAHHSGNIFKIAFLNHHLDLMGFKSVPLILLSSMCMYAYTRILYTTRLRHRQDVLLSVHCALRLSLECQKCCARTSAYWAPRRAASRRKAKCLTKVFSIECSFFISCTAMGACFRTYLKRHRMSGGDSLAICHLMKQYIYIYSKAKMRRFSAVFRT